VSKNYGDILGATISIITRLSKTQKTLGADTELITDVGMTSLQVMELVLEIEEEFDISFPLNRLPDIQTIGDLAEEIAALVSR